MRVVTGVDGLDRCEWGAQPDVYRAYHDEEWGRAVVSDDRLFEKICLEGFQAGLSWLTILRKRGNFREAFSDFDPESVARYDEADVERLLANPGIVRHGGKIRSTINNARRALELIDESGSLASYFWAWAGPDSPVPVDPPPITPASSALSKDLRKRGWSFVGPTTVYAFMQAMGLVNDHLAGCHVREDCELLRRKTLSLLGDRRN